jgi:hypothetical protein
MLEIRKRPDQWRLIEDLCLVNPTFYTFLAQIPSDTTNFSVLDLKDALFVLLHPEHQLTFVFKAPTQKARQITWTVLPQGFMDSPTPTSLD